jgi:hypothetical protein
MDANSLNSNTNVNLSAVSESDGHHVVAHFRMLPAAVKTLLERSKSTTPMDETLVIVFFHLTVDSFGNFSESPMIPTQTKRSYFTQFLWGARNSPLRLSSRLLMLLMLNVATLTKSRFSFDAPAEAILTV